MGREDSVLAHSGPSHFFSYYGAPTFPTKAALTRVAPPPQPSSAAICCEAGPSPLIVMASATVSVIFLLAFFFQQSPPCTSFPLRGNFTVSARPQFY